MASEVRFVALVETDRQLQWYFLPLEIDYNGLVMSKLNSIFLQMATPYTYSPFPLPVLKYLRSTDTCWLLCSVSERSFVFLLVTPVNTRKMAQVRGILLQLVASVRVSLFVTFLTRL